MKYYCVVCIALQSKLIKKTTCFKIYEAKYRIKGMSINQLTEREYEVNEQIARGNSVKEVAANLYLSPYTIDTHIKNIKKKTGARNIADLTRNFVLSLEEPKQFFKSTVAAFFLALHIFISVGDPDIDLRKPRQSRTRTHRTSRRIES